MLYKYEALTPEGEKRSGSIDAPNLELAINSIQNRNLIIVSIKPFDKASPLIVRNIRVFERVSFREIVMLSRQLSTLFEAKVPILDSLRLLASESENELLKKNLTEIVDDIQGGTSMSQAMTKHPKLFSEFYINMVRSGEESGKLSEIFSYLADYLERSYELKSKARNALFYPAFVFTAFIGVMILMLTVIIPKLKVILTDTGAEIPIYTKIILGTSEFIINYGVFLLLAVSGAIVFLWRYLMTKEGKYAFSRFQISFPIIGGLYKKLFLSRIADNLATLFSSGIPIVRAIEITSDVVGNEVYKQILKESADSVKNGNAMSETFSKYKEIPSVSVQMIRVGEEGGKLDKVLRTLSGFYKREVDTVLENLVSLIEPIMILVLGVGVGILLIGVLGPIYSITGSF